MKSELTALLRTIAGMGSAVFWGVAPQEIGAPYIVLNTVFADPVNTLDGADGMKLARVQVDCWHEAALTADDLLKQVEAKLDTWAAGGAAATPPAPTIYGAVRLGTNPDGYDPTTKHYKASADFSIHHE